MKETSWRVRDLLPRTPGKASDDGRLVVLQQQLRKPTVSAMGSTTSKLGSRLDCASIKNDYELVIRVSKQLELLLETSFGATGRGLHEKVTTARVRCFATLRI